MRALLSIDALGEEIALAVSVGDWERTVELLIQRRAELETAFAAPPETPAELHRLRELAEQVLNADRELVALALDARQQTVAELKKLRTGRRATHAYRHESA